MDPSISGVVVPILAAVIGAAIGAAIGVLTVLFVAKQLDISRVDMTSGELTAIDELLVQHPQFRACFYDGMDPEDIEGITDEGREVVKAIAARLVNGYATILLQSRGKPESSEFNVAWANATVARRYGNSIPCCDHLVSYIEEYGVTGKHQLKLMLEGLNDALATAKLQNDQKKVERLTARIKAVEKGREGVINRLEASTKKYERKLN
jgi:hypothetical protein